MKKINFENEPSVVTPLSAENLNTLQTNIEEGIATAIKEAKLAMYPVGAMYLSMTDTNPSTFIGGTWVQIAKGRTLIGVDNADADFDAPNKQGGEKTHKLTIDEMPIHNHDIVVDKGSGDAGVSFYGANIIQQNFRFIDKNLARFTGGDKAHNNLQPYITCYIWQRTA